ncbi:MAG: hypothetical protein KGJ43_00480 [Acidobacteriota bacterium]|nr:hypothetical protein [Acidobacteriota bacterium]
MAASRYAAACAAALLLVLVLGITAPGRSPRGAANPFAPGCPSRGAPEVVSATPTSVDHLRKRLAPLMQASAGREYSAGLVRALNLWSDGEPRQPARRGSASLIPAAYELRWWVRLPNGASHDVVADALEFATPQQAARFLMRASSPRCRSGGEAWVSYSPPGAHELRWQNPDHATEWDALMARGPIVYRVVDVPPTDRVRVNPTREAVESTRARLAVERLACVLPAAGCRAQPAAQARATLA